MSCIKISIKYPKALATKPIKNIYRKSMFMEESVFINRPGNKANIATQPMIPGKIKEKTSILPSDFKKSDIYFITSFISNRTLELTEGSLSYREAIY